MIKEEIAEEIENKFVGKIGLVKITFKNGGSIYNGRSIYGSFERLEDYDDLRKTHKYRFLPPMSNSIIIDCADIARVEFV